MPRVTLIGYRGTGKSTVGGLLATRLGESFVDADTALEERCGMRIGAFIQEQGEPAFRDAESALLGELLERSGGVLGTGGGVVVRAANRDLLRRRGRPVIWLSAPADVIRARLAADPLTAVRRPALVGVDPLAEIEAVLRDREAFYRETADVVVDAAAPAEEVAARIAAVVTAGGQVTP